MNFQSASNNDKESFENNSNKEHRSNESKKDDNDSNVEEVKDVNELSIKENTDKHLDLKNKEKSDKKESVKPITSTSEITKSYVEEKNGVEIKNKKKESSFLTSSIKKSDDIETTEDLKKIQEDYIETNINGKINFKSRCQLYMFNKEKKKFEERGVGSIMIVTQHDNNMTKIMMTRDGIMRFGCHHYINPRYPLVKNTKLSNAWVWMTTEDTIDDDKSDKKMYLVKFEEDSESLYFKEEYDKGLKSNKEILDK